MNYWLVKSEPSAYSWTDFEQEKRTAWTGVRNYQARNNLQGMIPGDMVLFYHSVKETQVVGLARVVREAFPDPTTDDPRWVAVELEPLEKLPLPVTLKQIKVRPELQNIGLLRQSQLSVMPLKREEFDLIIGLGNQE